MSRGGHHRRHAVRRLKRPLDFFELHVNQIDEIKRELCLPVLHPQVWQHGAEHDPGLGPGDVPLMSGAVVHIGGFIGRDRSTKHLQRKPVWRIASSGNAYLGCVVGRRPLVPAGSNPVLGCALDGDEAIRVENSGEVGVRRVHDPQYSSVTRVGKKAAGRLLDGIEHNGFPST